MADVHEPHIRSYNMSRIRSKDSKPEMIVRRFLHRSGLRFRLHVKDLPGKPDVVMKKYRAVVFVHGCFWHGHEGCRYAAVPKTRTEWWLKKIDKTKEKDKANADALTRMGWRVFEIWECELRGNETLKLTGLADQVKSLHVESC